MELEKNHMNFRVETGTLVKIITVGVIFWLAFLLRDVVFVILMAVVLASPSRDVQ
jgi:energy-converting hydrogenase Eha subunit B